MLESFGQLIKKMLTTYPPLLKIILTLKKNKLLQNTRIKKIQNNTLIISANNYQTYQLLLLNREKLNKYINQVFRKNGANVTIRNVKIESTPQVETKPHRKINHELIKKIREIREKLYGDRLWK
ncbi:MAG: hypothetical protein ABDH21_05645 [bacterium]